MVRLVRLQPGDRVLVRNVGLKGKQKLADIWDKYPYIVMGQPIGIPVCDVQRENDPLKKKLLHRNMLLPFRGLPYIDDREEETRSITPEPSLAEEEPTATSSESSTDNEAEDLKARNKPAQRYVIPKDEVKVRETP